MKMSGHDVLTLLILFVSGGYGLYGSVTGTGLGGWINHIQQTIFGFYYWKLSVILSWCLVGVLAAIVIFVRNKVSGSRDVNKH